MYDDFAYYYVPYSSQDEDSHVGRPCISVDMYEVEFLRSLGFTWTTIAEMLGVSRSTLYRRLEESNLSLQGYSNISNSQLDSLVNEIKHNHPNDGEVLLAAHLRSRDVHVPRARLRASIHRTDPNVASRRHLAVRRRVYHVEAPNSVWHIDGNHKLIHWRFVVHGAVDGYSRVALYLQCATNNLASTVLHAFTNATEEFGLPNCVRSDRGGENVDVWQFMYEQHLNNPNCVIVGSSTHNERIERFWRDINRCVLRPFANSFRSLESEGLLDRLNEIDMFCLHYCFLPRINKCLNCFKEAWNNHVISTEANATPYQLYLAGLIAVNHVPQAPHMQPSQQMQHLQSNDHVIVPRSRFHPCNTLIRSLRTNFEPLNTLCLFDKNLYRSVVHFVGLHLISGCIVCTES